MMRDLVEGLLLVLLVGWVGILLLINGVKGDHGIQTVVGIACCAIAMAAYFVLHLSQGSRGHE
jgi:hypothetical protein